ncbi:hypothetical protein C8R44DRAFT_771532 [Mycena epipterygia]|nr:hypothetical protein C8R44DRAFT_771532 [Mycena epipterygia]
MTVRKKVAPSRVAVRGCAAFAMYRHCGRRLLLSRNGFPEKQGILSGAQLRFKATTPPRSPRADLQSIPQALRELFPEPRKRDPNAPPKRGRGPLFYIACISPLFIWIEIERYFDPQPLLEKKRKRLLCERLDRLREESRGTPGQFADPKSVVAYMRLLLRTMLPAEELRNMHSDDICALLEQEMPDDLLVWLRDVCSGIHALSIDLSLRSENQNLEVKAAEKIQDIADQILRRSYLVVHHRFPPPTPPSS